MGRYVPNELHPWFLGVAALNAFVRNDSSSRLAMFCSQIGQPLVLNNGDVDRLSTGVSREFAGDVHDIRFPCNAVIEAVIHKYPVVLGSKRQIENTQTAIIYENAESPRREFGVIFKERYHSLHQHFGFSFVDTEAGMPRNLRPGQEFPRDTVIATSPSISPDGDLRLGKEVQTALLTHPSIIEDGIIVSDHLCREMACKGYGSRTVSWGEAAIPLNLYGDPNDPEDYKPFPDIGQYVNETGILFASRKMDERIAVSMLSRKALREVDFFDRTIYAYPNAKVIDVIVHRGNKDRSYMPSGTDTQCLFYYNKTASYYKSIVDLYNKLKRKHGENLHLSPELTNLIKTAIAYNEIPNRKHITPTMNLVAMDEWHVEIVFEYDIVPTNGYKMTGFDGDKGVITAVWPRAHMPVDCSGNVADAIMGPDSTFGRMNTGRSWRQYINAVCRIVGIRVGEMYQQAKGNQQAILEIYEYILGLYRIVSPPMYAKTGRIITTFQEKHEHVVSVIQTGIDHVVNMEGVHLHIPTDNPVLYYEVVAELMEYYPAPYGPVKFIGYNGQEVVTENPCLIGGLYMILLEKTGNLWSSIASPKMQHFATPGKMSNSDKYTNPGRTSPTRATGEAENRLYTALCGGKVMADIIDQSNSPVVHRHGCEEILRSERPTNIPVLIDRKRFPRGLSRIISLVRHTTECGGIVFKRDVISHD